MARKNNDSPSFLTILKKFLNHFIVKNLLILTVSGMILFWLMLVILRYYTHHGEATEVPDVTGLNMSDAASILQSQKMKFNLSDSVYVNTEKPGVIVNQYPEPGSKVKQNRNVYLVVNALAPEKIKMPNVVGVSLRQAKSLLESKGLVIGKLTYVPDMAKDYVLKQLYKGGEIRRGTEILKGSEIELVVGKGLSDEKTSVPDIIGYTLPEARGILTKYFLNFGVIIYDNSVTTHTDTLRAVIYKQKPDSDAEIKLGASVDVWLRVD